MLRDLQLPDAYWYDALRYAAHIHNVTPIQALDGITLEEAWSGNKPDISDLCIFRAQAFMHVPKAQWSKLGVCSLICNFIGFTPQCKAYKLIYRPSCQFHESHDVVFNEGGGSSCFERITIEPNSVPNSTITGSSPLPPVPSLPSQPTSLQLQAPCNQLNRLPHPILLTYQLPP